MMDKRVVRQFLVFMNEGAVYTVRLSEVIGWDIGLYIVL